MTTFREQFLGKCNGIHMDCAELSTEDVATFNKLYPEVLKKFKAMVRALPDFDSLDYASHKEGLMLGNRVHSASALISRLRGVSFSDGPEAWILDALFDGASADYWYEFEKEW